MATAVAWYWRFDDGETSSEEQPEHYFLMAGIHTIVCIVTFDTGQKVRMTYSQTVTDWSETSGELNGSHTNTVFRYALKKQQGINVMEITGDDYPVVEARSGSLEVFDDLGQFLQLVFDNNEKLWYHISTRPGPDGSGLSKIWKDKEGNDLSIEDITLSGSDPVSVKITSHSFLTGDTVKFASVGGTTELNGNSYTVTKTDDDNFTLDSTDSSDFTAWTSGGTATKVGTDPAPKVRFPEDRGEHEHFLIHDIETHLYVRPEDETNRDATGYDSDGYVDDLEFTLNIYEDGNQSTTKASMSDVAKAGEIIANKEAYANRIQYEVTVNKPEVVFLARQHYFQVDDVTRDPDTIKPTEATYEENLQSNWVTWLTRNRTTLRNMVDLTTLSGTATKTTGPDGKSNSAMTISSAVSIANDAQASGYLMLWHKTGYTISGVTLTQYTTSGTWILSYASGSIPANLSLAAGDVFDFRLYSSAIDSDTLSFYSDDIVNNNGKIVLPRW